ncbi:hypothetical protein EON65_30275 [archaeon]|nr:MAG: hypothetical protein EON65_30275 [archaeon]
MVVFQDLLNVQQAYLKESTMLRSKRLHMTGKERSMRLLYLFQKDLMPGISGQILESKDHRDHLKVKPVSKTARGLAWTFLVVLNASMLFYIFLFAVSQDEYRQSAWAQSFAIWLVAEILLVSTCMVLIMHVLVPSMIMKDVQAIKVKLMDSLVQYHRQLQNEHEAHQTEAGSNLSKQKQELTSSVFNAAEYLFVSYRLAQAFPHLRTAKIIAHYQTVWPRQSYQHVVDVSKSYDRKFTALTRSASMVALFFVSNLLTVPITIQDMVLQILTTVVTGYTFLIHVQLFAIYPVLVIVPTLCIAVVVHFLLQSRHRYQQQAALQLLIQDTKKPDSKIEDQERLEQSAKLESKADAEEVRPVALVSEQGGVTNDRRWSSVDKLKTLDLVASQRAEQYLASDGSSSKEMHSSESDDDTSVEFDGETYDGYESNDGTLEDSLVMVDVTPDYGGDLFESDEFSDNEAYDIHRPLRSSRSLPAIFSSSSSSASLSDSDRVSDGEVEDGDAVYVLPQHQHGRVHTHRGRRQSLQQGVDLLRFAQLQLHSQPKRSSAEEGEDSDGADQHGGSDGDDDKVESIQDAHSGVVCYEHGTTHNTYDVHIGVDGEQMHADYHAGVENDDACFNNDGEDNVQLAHQPQYLLNSSFPVQVYAKDEEDDVSYSTSNGQQSD